MKTLTLKEAADVLRVHPMTLRREAAEGRVPAARAGRAWIFLEEDLLDWIRSQYASTARAAGSTGETQCPSTDAQTNPVPNTGADSLALTENKYADLRDARAELMRSGSSGN